MHGITISGKRTAASQCDAHLDLRASLACLRDGGSRGDARKMHPCSAAIQCLLPQHSVCTSPPTSRHCTAPHLHRQAAAGVAPRRQQLLRRVHLHAALLAAGAARVVGRALDGACHVGRPCGAAPAAVGVEAAHVAQQVAGLLKREGQGSRSSQVRPCRAMHGACSIYSGPSHASLLPLSPSTGIASSSVQPTSPPMHTRMAYTLQYKREASVRPCVRVCA